MGHSVFSVLILPALLLAAPALAAFEGAPAAPASVGGFQGPSYGPAAVDTVAKALKAKDDTPCVLEGHIVSSGPERERYIFKDSTGQMVIELDDDLFAGRTVTPSSIIRIYGELDTRFARDAEVEVERFDILK
ncbi:NirD/YgiW/YdeI family stress tolerance protein [Mailhella sp.]|uniref:NirD/YgiW/YdeI family stress tolerance protein n=1 Tax=Mailhella sp. TaxID=1981029 RepID=UPI004062F780